MSRQSSILIVEDLQDIRDLLVSFLTDFGFTVHAAENGDEAMKVLDDPIPVDLMFSDIVLPGSLNGFALARRAVAKRPDLKILLATGYAEHLARNELMVNRGELLPKPYRLNELRTRIDLVLGSGPVQLNRVLRRIHDHWLEKSAGRPYPARADIDLDALAEARPHITFLDVVGAPPRVDFRYCEIGAALGSAMGMDMTGLIAGSSSPPAHRDFITGLYRETVSTGRPIYSASGFTYPQGVGPPSPGLSTERLFLPLGGPGGVVQILSAQTFDWMRRDTTVSYVLHQASDRSDIVNRFPDDRQEGQA